jgi:hypothetical protein
MATYELLEVAHDRVVTGQGIVIEDYDANPSLCRKGIWIGLATYFREKFTFSLEHEPDALNVFWRVNGVDLYPDSFYFGTRKVPGVDGVMYTWPQDDPRDAATSKLQHVISFTSDPGAARTVFVAQARYQRTNDTSGKIYEGPSVYVTISGITVKWAALNELDERKCHDRWLDLQKRYARWRKPKPGEPVMGLDHIRGEAATRMKAVADALESLDRDADPELTAALEADLSAQFRRAATLGEQASRRLE